MFGTRGHSGWFELVTLVHKGRVDAKLGNRGIKGQKRRRENQNRDKEQRPASKFETPRGFGRDSYC